LPSVDRVKDGVTGHHWDEPGWSTPRPWVAVTWASAISVVLGAIGYVALLPDTWELYQKDFGCIAVANSDSSYKRSRCAPAVSATRAHAANTVSAQPIGYTDPLGLGVGESR